MMKNNKGITIVSLMVIFVILLILSAAGVTAVYTGIQEVKDNKLNTELGMVMQAITEQYALAGAAGKLEKFVDDEDVPFWVGERIPRGGAIKLPVNFIPEDKNALNFVNNLQNNNPVYQEDFYYRLDKLNLEKIGVGEGGKNATDSNYTYIVNYKTGEVYNESKMVYSTQKLIYLPSTIYSNTTKNEDNESFNDW